MVIIKLRPLKEFCEKYPDAENSINQWIDTVQKADWSNFSEVKRDYATASLAGNDRVVFNIRGGHYRLIVLIIYRVRTVYIRFIGIHTEYDKIKASQV